jgi:tetratricopeptide (TPR) repeat protein
MIEKHVHQEFEENLKKKLPIKITNIEMWQLYANNEILDRYLKNEITRLKPHSFFYKIKKGGSIAMLTMLLISFASQEMPSSSSVSFLKVLQKIYHWNDLRTTELKLKFTEAFSPFWDNEDFKRHYSTYMIYEWIPKWENYVGTHEKDKILLSKAQIGKIIDWYRLALDFYKKKDEISGFANMKLGILYYINENYKTALTHLEIANKSEIHDLDKDDTLTYIAKTLEKDNQNEKAFNILMDIKDKKGYYSSKMYLSGYLFQQKKHSETIYVLKQVPENKLTELELYYLGESYFNEKEFNQSERICKKLFELSEKDNDTSSKLLSLSMLAEIYYQARDFFNSTVEYYLYFKELFLKKMYVTDKMRNDEQLKLNHFKTSIDEVCKMNDKDFRVNLWYFVYYNRSGKAELAVEYLKKHLEYGAREYEKDFTLWILQDIYNKK